MRGVRFACQWIVIAFALRDGHETMTDKNLTGHFLVASRYLRDPNFAQSVVLMIHHNDEGAMGVVINRPSDKTVREVWEMIGNDPCDRDDLIFIGGPVPGPLVALHSIEEFSQHEVLPGLHVATQRRRARCDRPQAQTSRCGCTAATPVGAAASWKARWKPAAGSHAGDGRRCVRRSRNDLENGHAADRSGDHGAGSGFRARAAGSVAELIAVAECL